MEKPEEKVSPSIPEKVPDAESAPSADVDSKKEEDELFYKQIRLKRRSEFKGHVHKIAIGALYFVALLYAGALLTWFYHLLAPEKWHYMPSQNYDILKNLLFGTIVGGLISQFANKIFSD